MVLRSARRPQPTTNHGIGIFRQIRQAKQVEDERRNPGPIMVTSLHASVTDAFSAIVFGPGTRPW